MELLPEREALAQAENLLASVEGALSFQQEQLGATNAALVSVEGSCSHLREATQRTEADASALSHRLAELSEQASSNATLAESKTGGTAALLATAASNHAQREKDAISLAERQQQWEQQLEHFHDGGISKKLDPIVYAENRKVVARVTELFNAERAQHEQQASFLHALDTSVADAKRAELQQRLGVVDAQHRELLAYRADFGEGLTAALTSYLRDGLSQNLTKAAALEAKLKTVHRRLRDVRRVEDGRSEGRVQACGETLAPLLSHAQALAKRMGVVDADSAMLQGNPRQIMLQQQQGTTHGDPTQHQLCIRSSCVVGCACVWSAIERAQKAATRERQRRERVQAEWEAEVRAHADNSARLDEHSGEMVSRSMAFGEKEYFEITREQLRAAAADRSVEMQRVLDEYDGREVAVQAAADKLTAEIDDLKKARMTMALSLAQVCAP